jgi:hypothetical protein
MFLTQLPATKVGHGFESLSKQSTSLFSCRRNWGPPPLPPPPPPAGELPPFWLDTLACGRVGGGPQFRRGDKHCGTLGM